MAATQAVSGFGTLLKRGDGGSPEVFTAIAELVDSQGPGLKTKFIIATHNQSPNGAEEKIASGIYDAGQVKITLNFLPGDTTHKGLISDIKSGVKRNFQLVWPDANHTTWPFTALVSDFEPKAPKGAQLSAVVTLDICADVPSIP